MRERRAAQVRYVQWVQFYDKLFNYDYNDVDSDGVANHEDFRTYDSGEATDTDGDGVGDQVTDIQRTSTKVRILL